MISFLYASFYYTLLFLHSYMMNIVVHTIHFFDYLVISRLKLCRELGFYPITLHYYACYYLSIFKFLGVNLYYKGDKILNEHTLWICNHRSKLDAKVLQAFFASQYAYNVCVSKYNVKYIPFIGTLAIKYKNLFIKLQPSQYEKEFSEKVPKLKDNGLSLIIFPEGNTIRPETFEKCRKFADQNKIKIFNNLLIPKLTGIKLIKKHGSFTKCGNLTLQYDGLDNTSLHSYANLFKVFPKDIYITGKYENIDHNNLYEKFAEKDSILDQPIDKNTFTPYYISNLKLIILYLFFFSFYACLYYVPYCFKLSLFLNIFTVIYTTYLS